MLWKTTKLQQICLSNLHLGSPATLNPPPMAVFFNNVSVNVWFLLCFSFLLLIFTLIYRNQTHFQLLKLIKCHTVVHIETISPPALPHVLGDPIVITYRCIKATSRRSWKIVKLSSGDAQIFGHIENKKARCCAPRMWIIFTTAIKMQLWYTSRNQISLCLCLKEHVDILGNTLVCSLTRSRMKRSIPIPSLRVQWRGLYPWCVSLAHLSIKTGGNRWELISHLQKWNNFNSNNSTEVVRCLFIECHKASSFAHFLQHASKANLHARCISTKPEYDFEVFVLECFHL